MATGLGRHELWLVQVFSSKLLSKQQELCLFCPGPTFATFASRLAMRQRQIDSDRLTWHMVLFPCRSLMIATQAGDLISTVAAKFGRASCHSIVFHLPCSGLPGWEHGWSGPKKTWCAAQMLALAVGRLSLCLISRMT